MKVNSNGCRIGGAIDEVKPPGMERTSESDRGGKTNLQEKEHHLQRLVEASGIQGTGRKDLYFFDDLFISKIADDTPFTTTPGTIKGWCCVSSAELMLAYIPSNISGEPFQPLWVVDSGATHHLTPHRSILEDLRTLNKPLRFGLADKSMTMVSKEVGIVKVSTGGGRTLKLMDVHHVPSSRVSLLSLTVMVRNGWKAEFGDKGGVLWKGNERLTMYRKGSLWSVHLGNSTPHILLSTNNPPIPKSKLEAEHQRLGHLGVPKLLELARMGLLSRKEYRGDIFRSIDQCETCLQSKMRRLPKNDLAPMLNGKGEGIGFDVDLAGPFTISFDGMMNLFVGVERSTGIIIAVPIESKSSSFEVLKTSVNRLEKQLGERLRVIRSDGGSEFASNEARRWYDERGIIHYTTTRYTPELNGAAEQSIGTIKGMIGSMLNDSKIDSGYWSFAARYSAVILNKTTFKGGKSAWERLTGRDVGIDSIKRFGERCFVQIPREIRAKADLGVSKGEPGRIIGQSENVSGWIVLLDNGKTVNLRDVRGTLANSATLDEEDTAVSKQIEVEIGAPGTEGFIGDDMIDLPDVVDREELGGLEDLSLEPG